jgi:hypothetical protein
VFVVRTHENEHRFWAMPPRRFKQTQSSQRIHLEFEEWNFAALVMRWLGRVVHDQVESVGPENPNPSRNAGTRFDDLPR